MKIAICADSHDNMKNISQFIEFCNLNKYEIILHCGDWCSDLTINYFKENFKGKIYGVFGNAHTGGEWQADDLKKNNLKIEEDRLELEVDGIKMAITHKPEAAKVLAETGKWNMVWYGHNHKPWSEKIINPKNQTPNAEEQGLFKETYMVNPGTLAGIYYRASFATYDTETRKLELIVLDQLGENN